MVSEPISQISTQTKIKTFNGFNLFWTLGQYWKVSRTGNLVNKSGSWQYSTKKWALPEPNAEGCIRDLKSGKFLSLKNDAEILVELEENIIDEALGQKWLRGPDNNEGWFTLTNVTYKKLISAASVTKTVGAGIFIYFYQFYQFLN